MVLAGRPPRNDLEYMVGKLATWDKVRLGTKLGLGQGGGSKLAQRHKEDLSAQVIWD